MSKVLTTDVTNSNATIITIENIYLLIGLVVMFLVVRTLQDKNHPKKAHHSIILVVIW
ncbi:hypothetical protein P4S61_17965 [Pseudoalteromonas sp. B160]